MYEAEYCDSHGGVFRITPEYICDIKEFEFIYNLNEALNLLKNRLVMPNLNIEYERKFEEPGVYYFQTEVKNSAQLHCCVVEVQQSYRYYKTVN